MNDLISTTSVYLAVLGLLYSAWYPSIESVYKKSEITPSDEQEKKELQELVIGAKLKLLWLAWSSGTLIAILSADFISIFTITLCNYCNYKIKAIELYSAVNTMYSALFIFTFIFLIHVTDKWKKLRKRLKDMK